LTAKVCLLSIPYITKLVIDAVSNSDKNSFFNSMAIFIILMLCFGIALASQFYLEKLIEERVINKIRFKMLEKISISKFCEIKDKSLGYFMERIFDDNENIRQLILDLPTEAILSIFYVAGIIIAMIILSLKLTLILLALVLLFIIFSKIFTPKLESINSDLLIQKETLKNITEESINGNIELRSLNCSSYLTSRISSEFKKYLGLKRHEIKLEMTYDYVLITGIMNASNLLIYGLGGYLALKNEMSIGALFSFTLYFSRIWTPVEFFMGLNKNYKIKLVSLNRIKEFLELEEENQVFEKLPEFEKLVLKNIGLSFGKRVIFDNLNVTINRGEKIALKGGNGSGKSTLTQLLTMLNTTYNGTITYNGLNYEDLSPKSIRDRLVLIPPSVMIFNDSVSNNITLGHHFNIESAFKSTPLEDILKKHNISLSKILSSQKPEISSGEQKLLQLTRTLCHDADIYILDEPLNYIDSAHKNLVKNWIASQFSDKTLIIISHDEDILEICDKAISL
jgi:ABC-type bacteriocin/lantibiotic exporter with double-glycine peptidase domain